jgi:hypothetical protein
MARDAAISKTKSNERTNSCMIVYMRNNIPVETFENLPAASTSAQLTPLVVSHQSQSPSLIQKAESSSTSPGAYLLPILIFSIAEIAEKNTESVSK